MIDPAAPIYVAGHRGMVGGAVLRALRGRGHRNIVTATRAEADLADRAAVEALFARHRPEAVVLAAAKVGGILANDRFGGDFIRENLLIQTNVIDAARRHGVRRFVLLGSSCIYPREAEQPIRIEAYEFVPDKAGPGRFRGGVPFRRDYRFLEQEGVLQVRSDRHRFPPYGLYGGQPGQGPTGGGAGPDQEGVVDADFEEVDGNSKKSA